MPVRLFCAGAAFLCRRGFSVPRLFCAAAFLAHTSRARGTRSSATTPREWARTLLNGRACSSMGAHAPQWARMLLNGRACSFSARRPDSTRIASAAQRGDQRALVYRRSQSARKPTTSTCRCTEVEPALTTCRPLADARACKLTGRCPLGCVASPLRPMLTRIPNEDIRTSPGPPRKDLMQHRVGS